MSERRTPAPRAKNTLPAPLGRPHRPDEPGVIDAEFRALSPPGRLLRWLREHWWALGPYLAYCTALWALAALAGWLIDSPRR